MTGIRVVVVLVLGGLAYFWFGVLGGCPGGRESWPPKERAVCEQLRQAVGTACELPPPGFSVGALEREQCEKAYAEWEECVATAER